MLPRISYFYLTMKPIMTLKCVSVWICTFEQNISMRGWVCVHVAHMCSHPCAVERKVELLPYAEKVLFPERPFTDCELTVVFA